MSFILSTQISEFSLLGLQTSPLPQLSLALEKTSALFISLPHSLKAEEKVSSRQNCHLHISAAFAFPPNWPTGQGVENQLGSEQAPPSLPNTVAQGSERRHRAVSLLSVLLETTACGQARLTVPRSPAGPR